MPNAKSQNEAVSIRNALENDALAIVQVHYNAVHTTAAKDYDDAILSGWSSLGKERVKILAERIKSNPENTCMFVAEINGKVVGYGEVVPANNELRAVYVSPLIGRRGVGGMLLKELEAAALKQGVSELWLDSSLTAEQFYLAHGFVSDGVGEHQLRNGPKMKCIKMHKNLAGENPDAK